MLEETLEQQEGQLKYLDKGNEGEVPEEGRLEKLMLEKLKYLNGIIDKKDEELEACKEENKKLWEDQLEMKKVIEYRMERLDVLEVARNEMQEKLEELEESREKHEEIYKRESIKAVEYLTSENLRLKQEKECLEKEKMESK